MLGPGRLDGPSSAGIRVDLADDQVNDGIQGTAGAEDGNPQRHHPVAEGALAVSQDLGVVGASGIELGDRHRSWHANFGTLLPQPPGCRVHAVRGRNHEQGRIGGPQAGPQLTDEVGVAGGVNEVDDHLATGNCGHRQLGGPFLAARRRSVPGRGRGDQVVEQPGFARAAGPDEDDVAQFIALRDDGG